LVDLRLDHHLTEHGAVYLALDNAFNARIATSVTGDGVVTYGRPTMVRIGLSFAR
jgi:predicted aminopeptidase